MKIEIEFGEAGQTAFPVFPFVVERLVRDLDPFGIRPAEDTGSDIAVADRIAPSFPVRVMVSRSVAGLRLLPFTRAVRRGVRLPNLIGSR